MPTQTRRTFMKFSMATSCLMYRRCVLGGAATLAGPVIFPSCLFIFSNSAETNGVRSGLA